MSLPLYSEAEAIAAEIVNLRRHLDELAGGSDDELAQYELARPPMPPRLYWRLRWIAGRILRWLESLYLKRPDPFPPGLKTTQGSAKAKPLLIWAIGANRPILREACRRFAEMQIASSGFAPVLVTDVADFAFFSRLGWLVEYAPAITGEGRPYVERKLGFLARLYRSAPAVPISASRVSWEEVRQYLASAPVSAEASSARTRC